MLNEIRYSCYASKRLLNAKLHLVYFLSQEKMYVFLTPLQLHHFCLSSKHLHHLLSLLS